MEQPKKKSGWPFFLIGLLIAGASTNLFMVFLAVSDPSFAVEDQYYKRAIDWDKEMAQQKQNALLGWSIQLQTQLSKAVSAAKNKGRMALRVHVLDAKKKAIVPTEVKIVSFHNARASQLYRRTLKPNAKGIALAAMPFPREGIWEFRFEITQGKKRFTHTMQRRLQFSKTSGS